MLNSFKTYLLALVLLFNCACAMSQDIVMERAIFEDPSGQMLLDQIKKANFAPAHEVVFKGFSRSAFWIRLKVEVPQANRKLSLQIRPNLLDEVSVYYTDPENQSAEIAAALNSRKRQNQSYLNLPPGEQTIYFRMTSTGGILIGLQVMTAEAASLKAMKDEMKFGSVVAIYALLFFILLFVLTEYPSQLVLYFFVHLMVCFVFYLLLFDVRFDLIPEEWAQNKTAARFSTILNFLSFSILLQAVFGRVRMMVFQKYARISAVIASILAVTFLAGEHHLALKLTSVFATLMTLALIGMLSWVFVKFLKNQSFNLKLRVLFCLIALAFFAIVCVAMLQLLGVVAPTPFLLESPNWRAIFMPLTLIGLIWLHEQRNKKEFEKTKTEKLINEIRDSELKLRLQTQSQFTAMLMHELKTPLYIIQIAASSLGRNINTSHPDSKRLNNIGRALDDVNFILDRCVQAEQLDQNDLPIQKIIFSLKSLLAEINHLNGFERVQFSGMSDAKVLSDYQYARIVIVNLMTNALKYSLSDSPVLVHVEPIMIENGEHLKIRVSNTVGSHGRPNPLKVFTKYYREEAAKSGAGAGLGLWLANSIASKLGSELQCITEGDWVHFDFFLEIA